MGIAKYSSVLTVLSCPHTSLKKQSSQLKLMAAPNEVISGMGQAIRSHRPRDYWTWFGTSATRKSRTVYSSSQQWDYPI